MMKLLFSLAKSAKSLQGNLPQIKKIKLSNSASYLKMLLGAMAYIIHGIYYT